MRFVSGCFERPDGFFLKAIEDVFDHGTGQHLLEQATEHGSFQSVAAHPDPVRTRAALVVHWATVRLGLVVAAAAGHDLHIRATRAAAEQSRKDIGRIHHARTNQASAHPTVGALHEIHSGLHPGPKLVRHDPQVWAVCALNRSLTFFRAERAAPGPWVAHLVLATPNNLPQVPLVMNNRLYRGNRPRARVSPPLKHRRFHTLGVQPLRNSPKAGARGVHLEYALDDLGLRFKDLQPRSASLRLR
ncbi:MAG: hypothetical protein WB795_15485 [Candidatus Acidiferrales bacterium]